MELSTEYLPVFDSLGKPLPRVYQWDTDVIVTMKDKKITENSTVHFANNNSTQALVVETSYEDGVLSAKIPNSLLCEASPIIGYVYAESDDGNRTRYKFKIHVSSRKQPSDYVYPGDKDFLRLETVLEKSKQYAESAELSAEKAASAVQEYLDEHGFSEQDPTVPDWAKAETKPTYTAAEVHALDEDNAISLQEIDEIFKQVFGG